MKKIGIHDSKRNTEIEVPVWNAVRTTGTSCKDNMSDRFFNTLFEKDFAFFKVSVSFLKKNKPAQLFTIVMNHFLRLNIRTAIRLFRP